MKRKKILLTRAQFDYIHIGALVNGGIGAGAFVEYGICYEDGTSVPLCGIGMLRDADGYYAPNCKQGDAFLCVPNAAVVHGISDPSSWPFSAIGDNDMAVARINKRRGKPEDARVPFGAWVREMNIDIAEVA